MCRKAYALEVTVGRQLLTRDGLSLGRIEAIKAVRDHNAWMTSEFRIGMKIWAGGRNAAHSVLPA